MRHKHSRRETEKGTETKNWLRERDKQTKRSTDANIETEINQETKS
jgi:hypothetical protein